MTGRGHPRVLTLMPGQAGNAPQATVTAVIGDRGYDSDAIVANVCRLRARVVIPPDEPAAGPHGAGQGTERGGAVLVEGDADLETLADE